MQESIDSSSAAGRLVMHVFAALGQFEVELLRERTRIALAASRARGRGGGRPRVLDESRVRAARAMLAGATMSGVEIARQLGVRQARYIAMFRQLAGWKSALWFAEPSGVLSNNCFGTAPAVGLCSTRTGTVSSPIVAMTTLWDVIADGVEFGGVPFERLPGTGAVMR